MVKERYEIRTEKLKKLHHYFLFLYPKKRRKDKYFSQLAKSENETSRFRKEGFCDLNRFFRFPSTKSDSILCFSISLRLNRFSDFRRDERKQQCGKVKAVSSNVEVFIINFTSAFERIENWKFQFGRSGIVCKIELWTLRLKGWKIENVMKN